MARENIPEEMLSLSRTARNFSFLLPFVNKVRKDHLLDSKNYIANNRKQVLDSTYQAVVKNKIVGTVFGSFLDAER